MRTPVPMVVALVAMLTGCATAPKVADTSKSRPRVQITQFYPSPGTVTKGTSGNLCYGVEAAAKVTLDPPAGEVWPSQMRCLEISPKQATRYTLTATGEDGQTDVRTVEVRTVEVVPEPRLYDLWVNALEVGAGEQVKICFKTENAVDVEISTGQLYKSAGCMTDYPKSTTAYKIAAVSKDNRRDRRTITVKVR